MRAAIYNPYWDTLGGGERYSASVAKVLLNAGYKVDIQWKDGSIKKKLESRFGIDLGGVKVVADINRGDKYDVCFWVSDGSIPMLLSRINLLHFQIPFHDVGGRSLINKMKLFRANKIVVNSEFTKKFIDREFSVNSVVLYPPIDTESIKAGRKENVILFVGRFSQLKQAKHQDLLIKCFKELYDGGAKNWRLILAGGSEVGAGDYIKKLMIDSQGYPIAIKESPSFSEIIKLYAKAKIFWSASGYGVDAQKEPERVEHFGMSDVEAMSASAIPIICNKGGHTEIIEDSVNGFLWNEPHELVAITKDLISKPKQLEFISTKSTRSSKKYSLQRFENELTSFIK